MSDDFPVDQLLLPERQRPQRFRKELHAIDANCRLACLRPEKGTVYADDVAEIEVGKHRERLVAQLVFPEIELDLSRRICEMRESSLPVCAPGDDSPGESNRRTGFSIAHHCQRRFGCVLSIEAVGVRSYAGRLQGCQFFATRLENEVKIFGHAAAVVDSPVCFKYASMKGSIAPSITFCTSGILSSVRWSLTIVYGWNT